MKSKLQKFNAVLLLSAASSTVSAAGFAIYEQGVSGLGRAFAGSSAIADDASTNFFNPAGLTYLEQAEFNLGLSFISISSDFTDEGSSLPPALAQPLTGGNGGIDRNDALVPAMYYTRPLSENVKFGFGINAPFGLVTEYEDDWTGRYFAVKSDLRTINFNPSLAFKLSEALSVGVGISAQYADLELTQMADLGTNAYITSGFNPGFLPFVQNADGKARLEADDWGYGWNLGFIYQYSDATRLGMSYRSKISHTFKGEGKLRDNSNTLIADENIQGDLDLPETLSVSIFHQINSAWSLATDVTWTRWSRFKELAIESDGPFLSSVKPEDWENTLRYSVGVDYRHNSQWQFRAGVAYDETPVPNAQRRTPRIPDNDRIWVSVGATYQYSETLILDTAYTHLFVNEVDIDDTNDSGYNLSGEFETAIDIFAIQLRWLMD
jgi:long-chain fatty acid transport protein